MFYKYQSGKFDRKICSDIMFVSNPLLSMPQSPTLPITFPTTVADLILFTNLLKRSRYIGDYEYRILTYLLNTVIDLTAQLTTDLTQIEVDLLKLVEDLQTSYAKMRAYINMAIGEVHETSYKGYAKNPEIYGMLRACEREESGFNMPHLFRYVKRTNTRKSYFDISGLHTLYKALYFERDSLTKVPDDRRAMDHLLNPLFYNLPEFFETFKSCPKDAPIEMQYKYYNNLLNKAAFQNNQELVNLYLLDKNLVIQSEFSPKCPELETPPQNTVHTQRYFETRKQMLIISLIEFNNSVRKYALRDTLQPILTTMTDKDAATTTATAAGLRKCYNQVRQTRIDAFFDNIKSFIKLYVENEIQCFTGMQDWKPETIAQYEALCRNVDLTIANNDLLFIDDMRGVWVDIFKNKFHKDLIYGGLMSYWYDRLDFRNEEASLAFSLTVDLTPLKDIINNRYNEGGSVRNLFHKEMGNIISTHKNLSDKGELTDEFLKSVDFK